jgi:aryl-alcohol dehydrogenase-like predicted oxidoreductase
MADHKIGAGEIPQRPLGRTGAKVSALGWGRHHLGDFKTIEEAIRLVHEAVDAGITFFDNCWGYWNGRAEDWLGRGLKGRRDKVFLMTKACTHSRGADLASIRWLSSTRTWRSPAASGRCRPKRWRPCAAAVPRRPATAT